MYLEDFSWLCFLRGRAVWRMTRPIWKARTAPVSKSTSGAARRGSEQLPCWREASEVSTESLAAEHLRDKYLCMEYWTLWLYISVSSGLLKLDWLTKFVFCTWSSDHLAVTIGQICWLKKLLGLIFKYSQNAIPVSGMSIKQSCAYLYSNVYFEHGLWWR